MSEIKGKVVLVTGGTSGIGLGCTELFARDGAKLVTMSIQAQQGNSLAERLTGEGHDCVFHFGDVSKEADVKAAVDLAVEKFGRLDGAVANAGVLRNQRITDLELDDFHTMINVNLLGAVLVAKHAIPVMERQGKGCICLLHHLGGRRNRLPGTRRLRRLQGGRGGPDPLPDDRSQSQRRAFCGRQPGHDRHANVGSVLRRLGQTQRGVVCGRGQEDPRAAVGPADRRSPGREIPAKRRRRVHQRKHHPLGRRHPGTAALVGRGATKPQPQPDNCGPWDLPTKPGQKTDDRRFCSTGEARVRRRGPLQDPYKRVGWHEGERLIIVPADSAEAR